MEKTAEYSALIANRESLYGFLGRLYRLEIDQPLLDKLKVLCFPVECDDKELAAGYRLLEEAVQHAGSDSLLDLAVDYARVFLGAGIAGDDAAYPYESVYTSPKRLIMQDARDQVADIYRANGLTKDQALDFPEDHISLELEFMIYLCQKTQQAVSKQDWLTVTACLQEQQDFLSRHLLNWVPGFCTDIEKFTRTSFYKGVAKITNAYLRLEQAILADMIADCRGCCA